MADSRTAPAPSRRTDSSWKRAYRLTRPGFDLLALSLSLWLAYLLRFDFDIEAPNEGRDTLDFSLVPAGVDPDVDLLNVLSIGTDGVSLLRARL